MNDSIITNVANMPSFKKLQQIRVSSFDELLDAYSELHLPINCYEPASKKESVFFIIGNGNVWVYRLKKCKIENDR